MANRYMRRPDGTTGSIPHDVIVTVPYDANAVDTWVFIADDFYEVVGVRQLPRVAGSDGGAVTADVKKDGTDTEAPTSGTTVLASTLDLKATADTLVTADLTATAADRRLAPGDRLGIDFAGTLTAAVGLIQINLKHEQTKGGK